jgi:hypothetical protein
MSHDEVKQLTLEQLDDLFRLEVIEADTLLWQPGMTEWLPLSVVAGLEDEEPNPVNIPVSLPPPRPLPRATPMTQTQTAWPPKLPAPSNPPPPPGARSAPPPSVRAEVSASRAPAASSWPPPAAWSSAPPRQAPVSGFASTVQEPPRSAPAPTSVAPVVYSDPFTAGPSPFATIPSMRASRQSSGGGSWMVLLAVAAGAVVTLYRNDIVHAAARSIGQEGQYLKIETALGGPSFGTPRAVEQMAAAAAALSATSPSAEADAPARTAANAPATTTTSTPEPAATQAPSPTPTEPSTTLAAGSPEKKEDKATIEPAKTSPSKASAQGTRAVSHAAPARPPAVAAADPFSAPKKAKKGKGNEFDPLNGSL